MEATVEVEKQEEVLKRNSWSRALLLSRCTSPEATTLTRLNRDNPFLAARPDVTPHSMSLRRSHKEVHAEEPPQEVVSAVELRPVKKDDPEDIAGLRGQEID